MSKSNGNSLFPIKCQIPVIFSLFCLMSQIIHADRPVVIGSKIDTESNLLCQMIHLTLSHQGLKIIDKCSTGVTQVVRKALLEGEIDLYPEYTGNVQNLVKNVKTNSKDPLKIYQTLVQADLKQNKIVWLKPAPANNTFVIAITKKMANSEHINSMDDFARYVNSGNHVKLIGSYEFVSRADGLKAFESKYKFKLKSNQLIMLPGGNTAQTETALARGANKINAAMAYGTDGQLAALNLVALKDTQGAQETYQPAVTIRASVLNSHPEIKSSIESLFAGLSSPVLSELNSQIVVGGQTPKSVAEQYLKQRGFIK